MRKNILKENVDMKKKLSEKTKEQKAITLIALVITIIVLLILSSVSIAMITGENGIIGKATSPRILLTQNGKNIEISITERGENITVLEILDSIDQVIASATKESMTKNEQSYVFNYSFTAEGTYVVKIATQQGKEYTKEVIIDLTPPANPVISSNYGYPVITENGVKQDGTTKITYDIGENIDNYYSLDGTNWHKYTGEFQYAQTGTIYAKSVKKSNGTETKVSKTISIPSDALGAAAYDGSDTTYVKMPYGADYLSFYSCSKVYEVAPYDS